MYFRGPYYFLSNNYVFPFKCNVDGQTYEFQSAQVAFLAKKFPSRAEELSKLSHADAVKLAKSFKPKETVPNFTERRKELMESVLREKFSAPFLKEKLANVTDRFIKMENDWGDRYWGVFVDDNGNFPPPYNMEGKGENVLGQLLTKLRDEARAELGMPPVFSTDESQILYKVQHHGYVTFDTETTGFKGEVDEILQITIVGQYGEVLLSTYVKPERCSMWGGAEHTNHISPSFVEKYGKNKTEVANAVKEIFDAADVIFGHNVSFDTRMVESDFGYDFEEKQRRDLSSNGFTSRLYREKLSSLEELVKSFIERIKAGESQKSIQASLCEIDADYFKKFGKFCIPSDTKKRRKMDHDLIDDDNRLQRSTLKDIVRAMDENDPETLEGIAGAIIENVSIIDTYPYAKKYLADEITDFSFCEKDERNFQLGTLIGNLFPERYDYFSQGAHDAEIDTIFTAMVADYISQTDKSGALSFCKPVENSVANMFGLMDGVLCNLVVCDEKKLSNFTKRIFSHHPEVREKYALAVKNYSAETLEGKVVVAQMADSQLKVANIFCSNVSSVPKAVERIASKYAGKNVFVPVVTDGRIVTDGFGQGMSGWAPLEKELLSFKNGGICLVDTQTGDIFPAKDTGDKWAFEKVNSVERVKEEALEMSKENSSIEIS